MDHGLTSRFRENRGRRELLFGDLPASFSGPGRPKKTDFFCCLGSRDFCTIARNQVGLGCRPDIRAGGSVQKILKKVKKRLVSPLKPR